ncbi:MAG: hypothetical protein ACR2OD_08385, partial [Gaiellaceae bacterium]
MSPPIRRLLGATVIVALIVVASSALTASNTVPASNLGEDLRSITANDVKPVECAGISLTAIVTNGTAANELVLGTAGAETNLRGRRGDDCILGGAGNDTIRANRDNDVLLG